MRALAALGAVLMMPMTAAAQPVCMEAVLAGTQGHSRLTLEVAHTPEAREQGLMGRTHLPAGRGMLFVFDHPDRWPFWMHSTPSPLDIVPLDEEGRVVEVLYGAPYSETLMAPAAPTRRVLEVPAGTLEALGALPPNGALVLVGGAACP